MGITFCIVNRGISSYEAGTWRYGILTQDEIQTKIANRESFNLTTDDDGDIDKAYFTQSQKRILNHLKKHM